MQLSWGRENHAVFNFMTMRREQEGGGRGYEARSASGKSAGVAVKHRRKNQVQAGTREHGASVAKRVERVARTKFVGEPGQKLNKSLNGGVEVGCIAEELGL